MAKPPAPTPREIEVMRRMLQSPPKPHEDMKVAPAKKTTPKKRAPAEKS